MFIHVIINYKYLYIVSFVYTFGHDLDMAAAVKKIIIEVSPDDYEWIRKLCYEKYVSRRVLFLCALEIAFGKRKG